MEMMQLNLPQNILNDIKSTAKKYSLKRVMLFGSQAKGTNRTRSDIDLAIIYKNSQYAIFNFTADLNKNANTLLTFDIVDYEKATDELKQEIQKYGIVIYEKFDNFKHSLKILQSVDFSNAYNEIYRIGIISQFNLTFELAWKCLQQIMQMHEILEAATGSPREVLKLAYKTGFINNEKSWLQMLLKRNSSIYIYSENEANEIVNLIQTEFIVTFVQLSETLQNKLDKVQEL